MSNGLKWQKSPTSKLLELSIHLWKKRWYFPDFRTMKSVYVFSAFDVWRKFFFYVILLSHLKYHHSVLIVFDFAIMTEATTKQMIEIKSMAKTESNFDRSDTRNRKYWWWWTGIGNDYTLISLRELAISQSDTSHLGQSASFHVRYVMSWFQTTFGL